MWCVLWFLYNCSVVFVWAVLWCVLWFLYDLLCNVWWVLWFLYVVVTRSVGYGVLFGLLQRYLRLKCWSTVFSVVFYYKIILRSGVVISCEFLPLRN